MENNLRNRLNSRRKNVSNYKKNKNKALSNKIMN